MASLNHSSHLNFTTYPDGPTFWFDYSSYETQFKIGATVSATEKLALVFEKTHSKHNADQFWFDGATKQVTDRYSVATSRSRPGAPAYYASKVDHQENLGTPAPVIKTVEDGKTSFEINRWYKTSDSSTIRDKVILCPSRNEW